MLAGQEAVPPAGGACAAHPVRGRSRGGCGGLHALLPLQKGIPPLQNRSAEASCPVSRLRFKGEPSDSGSCPLAPTACPPHPAQGWVGTRCGIPSHPTPPQGGGATLAGISSSLPVGHRSGWGAVRSLQCDAMQSLHPVLCPGPGIKRPAMQLLAVPGQPLRQPLLHGW